MFALVWEEGGGRELHALPWGSSAPLSGPQTRAGPFSLLILLSPCPSCELRSDFWLHRRASLGRRGNAGGRPVPGGRGGRLRGEGKEERGEGKEERGEGRGAAAHHGRSAGRR